MRSVAAVYYDLGGRLGLDAIALRIEALPGDGQWQTMARNALRDDLSELQRVLTRDVVAQPIRADGLRPRVEAWESTNAAARERAKSVVADVVDTATPDLAMLSVALRELRNLAGGAASPAPADVGTG